MSKLDASRLDVIFRDSLFKDGEDSTDHVVGEGILHNFGLHPGRLESHRQEISDMLDGLPPEFHEKTGGGWSFLNACDDKDGRLWGQHTNMEQLFAIGQALGIVKCQTPRDMWDIMPGSMPYYVVLAERGLNGI